MLNSLQDNRRATNTLGPRLVIHNTDKRRFIGRQLRMLKPIFFLVIRAALKAEVDSMRRTLKLAVQWLGKAHAEGVHLNTVMPNHLDYTIRMVEAAIKGTSK